MPNLALGLLWFGFLLYAFFLAPPNQPDTASLIVSLSTGQWAGINSLVVALFNLMGVWPMIYSAVMLPDGRGQRLRAWPFALASFGVGAFMILPYLVWRQPNPEFNGKKGFGLSILDSRWLGLAIALGTLTLLGYGVWQGDWSNFVQQWRTSRFIHVMSLDFVLLCLLFPVLLKDDLLRRNQFRPWKFWAIALVPLMGPALYLVLRSPLVEKDDRLAAEPAMTES